jgi:hypothetical protein
MVIASRTSGHNALAPFSNSLVLAIVMTAVAAHHTMVVFRLSQRQIPVRANTANATDRMQSRQTDYIDDLWMEHGARNGEQGQTQFRGSSQRNITQNHEVASGFRST